MDKSNREKQIEYLSQSSYNFSEWCLPFVILAGVVFVIGLYMLGKSDGYEDASKASIENCATVEIVSP